MTHSRSRKGSFLSEVAADFRAVLDNDPAARGPWAPIEVALTYPGFHAVLAYRIAHRVWRLGIPLLPRVVSILARFITGVEIHPAARIREGLFIDHANGVVIGETAEIGRNCVLFHQVTLGGTGKEKGKRHPTLGDNVVVGTGAKILGSFRIGNNVYVGANSVVLSSVPDNCTVVGIPGRIVIRDGERIRDGHDRLDHVHLPDPVRDRIMLIQEQIRHLSERMGEPPPPPSKPEDQVTWGENI